MSQRYARPVSYAAISPEPSGVQIGITRALAAAVVVLAARDESPSVANTAVPVTVPASHETIYHGTTRYDGGPEEGTRGPNAHTIAAGNRYDGGPVGGH